MAYRDFKMSVLEQEFGIIESVKEIVELKNSVPFQPSAHLSAILEDAKAGYLTLSTEKALSEQIVAPILVEMVKINPHIQLFSGETIEGDKTKGLNGEIDFILSQSTTKTLRPKAPIFCVTEAKISKVEKAIPQAAAQMLGIKTYNEAHNQKLEKVFGIVTDGNTWRFLKLENNILEIDQKYYSLSEISAILGNIQAIIDLYT